MIFLTEEADIFLCGDEASWSTASYGKAGTGVTVRVKKNPGVTKISQTVLLSNVNFINTCEYMQIHWMHRKPPGCTVMGKI